ncbi:MAG: excinuclease ABC subunit UvrC [Thermodesulfobacteriota bacterium]
MFTFTPKEYPAAPGVYLMKDASGRILYVGKAKDLRRRLASYFRGQGRLTPKTRLLVDRVRTVDVMGTATEKEALLLENSLIKKHRPRFNITLRDDKSYVLFRLSKADDWPRLTMTRRVVRDGSAYWGPFTSALAARETWKLLGKVFPLRKCRDAAFRNRVRPCLHHHLGQCLGPCVLSVPREEYAALVRRVEQFLSGRSADLGRQIEAEMRQASEDMRYEEAARLRDQLKALRATVERQAAVLPGGGDLDAAALAASDQGLALAVLFVRQGRLLDKAAFFWPGLGLEEGPEAAASFLGQFYWGTRFIPERILLPFPPDDPALAEMLSERRGGRVVLAAPRTADEKRLLEMARANAAEAAAREREREAGGPPPGLARALHLAGPPERVEGVDVSHLAGEGVRVAQAVFVAGLPRPDEHRAYVFPELEGGGDDYRAMAAWVGRRLASGPPWPDLALLDGGRGQLAAAVRAMEEAGLAGAFPLAAIAKAPGEEGRPDRRAGALADRVFLPGRVNPVPLKPGSPELLFLQRVRDAAHDLAIGRQRRARRRELLRSGLESLPGVGEKTARLLWDAYGSLEAMAAATADDLARLPGLGKKKAAALAAALKSLTSGTAGPA